MKTLCFYEQFINHILIKVPVQIISLYLPLLISQATTANPCAKSFLEKDPLIKFAKKHTGDNLKKKMPLQWTERIIKDTSQWTTEDKINFLRLLTNRTGIENTLNIIKATSTLEALSYNDLFKKVSFYDTYTKEPEIITYHLNKSINNFKPGRVEEISQVINFLELRITKREVINILRQDITKIANMNVLDLQYLEKHFYGKERMQQVLINKFIDLPVIHLKELKKTLEFVKKYFSKTLISTITNKDSFWIFRINFDDKAIKEIREIKKHFGEKLVKKIIKLIIARTSEIYINFEDEVMDTHTMKELYEFAPEYFGDNVQKAINKLSDKKNTIPVSQEKDVIYKCIHDCFRWQLSQFLITGDYIAYYLSSNPGFTDKRTISTLEAILRELKISSMEEDLQGR